MSPVKKMEMETLNIFEEKFESLIKNSVKSVQLENSENDDITSTPSDLWRPTNPDSLTCSYCRVQFKDAQTQREHYKLDWHRYNLKQSLFFQSPISEDEFVEKSGKDDLSSISGSDSEKEDTLDTFAMAQGKIFLQNDLGKVFSVYRCLLFDRKEEASETVILNRLKECCVMNKKWTVLMLGGGHFAGVVFQGKEPILHKTFHCYTVRAGQGGSQSSRDNRSGGSQPKSAGASLRRYNEQALVQHVKDIIESWKAEIEKTSLIIYRASGPYNRSVLFGGNPALLDKSDRRLRTIPFSTRRATFTEVKRVHSLLCQAHVYDSLELAAASFSKQKTPEHESKRNKIRSACINRAKSRETVERPLPGQHLSPSNSDLELNKIEKETSDGLEDLDMSVSDLEINLGDLLEPFGDTLTPEQRKRTPRKKKPKKSKAKKERELAEARKNDLSDVVAKGNLERLKLLLNNHITSASKQQDEEQDEEKLPEIDIKSRFVNEVLNEHGCTMLHIAAMNEQEGVLEFLLENEADPCIKNKNQQTAYTSSQSKVIRDALKQFAKDNPDKFNYNKANIPTNTLTNEEIAEKRKAQRQIKRQKEKEKKKENEVRKQEQHEKDRFLQLSDREKRALAAERRILSQTGTVIARCFLCASDMSGKVPFEYMNNRFCTIECLKAHRMQNPQKLS